MGLDIPPEEVDQTRELLTSTWTGPGSISIGVFSLAKEKFKVAIWTTNKSNFALVMVESLMEYTSCKGVNMDPRRASISIVVPDLATSPYSHCIYIQDRVPVM